VDSIIVTCALAGAFLVLLAAVVLSARALDRRSGRRIATVLDAIGGLRSQIGLPLVHDRHLDRHCHGAECFQGVDVCACGCAACVEEREALLREQGE
jgi:hypothetical protein